MKQKIPKELLNSQYRKEMWRNSQKMLSKLEDTLEISSAYLLGSFTTKKRRPADVDFIILVQTKENKKYRWSLDLVIAPENNYGNFVLDDAIKWMKQKYGSKYSVIKLK